MEENIKKSKKLYKKYKKSYNKFYNKTYNKKSCKKNKKLFNKNKNKKSYKKKGGNDEEYNILVDIVLNYFGIINITNNINNKILEYKINNHSKLKNDNYLNDFVLTIRNNQEDIARECFKKSKKKECEDIIECEMTNILLPICTIKNKTKINLKNEYEFIKESYVCFYKKKKYIDNYINLYKEGCKFYIAYIIYVLDDNDIEQNLNRYIIVYENKNNYYITYLDGYLLKIPNNIHNYYRLETRNIILKKLFEDDKDKYIFCGHSEGSKMAQCALINYENDNFWKNNEEIKKKCYSIGSGISQNVYLNDEYDIIDDLTDETFKYIIKEKELKEFNDEYKNRHLYISYFEIDSDFSDKVIFDPFFFLKKGLNNNKISKEIMNYDFIKKNINNYNELLEYIKNNSFKNIIFISTDNKKLSNFDSKKYLDYEYYIKSYSDIQIYHFLNYYQNTINNSNNVREYILKLLIECKNKT